MNTPRNKRAGNRRRKSYELTQSQSVGPVILLASLAAISLHVVGYFAAPTLKWSLIFPVISIELEEEEVVRIVANEAEMKQHKAEAAPPEPIEQVMPDTQEPEEIDLLDLDIEELVMAPGDTELVVAAPPKPAAEESLEAFAPDLAELNMQLAPAPVSAAPAFQELDMTTVNTNEVVINAMASETGLDTATKLREADLKADANNTEGLPTDTRSLSDLMQVESLGAQSGVARLGADLLFKFGKAQLLNSARITMIQLAALICKNPKTRFIIEGHTDSFGGEAYNEILSLQRAAAVRDWLKQNQIPTDNVYLRACASSKSLSSHKGSKEKQKLNRRVEIHMRKPSEALPKGALPASTKVDLKTPIEQQIRNRS